MVVFDICERCLRGESQGCPNWKVVRPRDSLSAMQTLVLSPKSPGHGLEFLECSGRGLSYSGIWISPLLIWADLGGCCSRQAPYGSASTACPPWAFGPGCSEDCLCEQSHTRSCNSKDGSCSCKAGFQGERCEAGESLEEREVPRPLRTSLPSYNCVLPLTPQSASQAPLGQAAETVAPAGQVWPVTL